DEHADPKIQLRQATEAEQKRHQQLTAQAAEVIGNRKRLSMQLARAGEKVGKLQDQARAALGQAEAARTAGDTVAAGEFEQSAEVIAAQLVAAEQQQQDLAMQIQAADQAAAEAQQAVEQSAVRLQETTGASRELTAQLEQARMQEQQAQT